MAKHLTYKSSGVDIAKANAFVDGIKQMVKSTQSPSVLNRQKAFGALFALERSYRSPVLVASTDGVGTKLLIAKAADKHDTVGIDLVAMNVNDVLCSGARPLFFLDYIACGKVKPQVLTDVVKGIAEGCRQAGCALVGGETAEMPGLYAADEYDLAGFAVGVVERSKIIDGNKIREGDKLIGLPSSGIHSNGYSLVRKVFSPAQQRRMVKELLAPTRIYVRPVLQVIKKFPVHGIAHMTGGAYYEKLTKVLPQGKCFLVDRTAWPRPNLFHKIQKQGKINDSEMFRTFNMGIGMVLILPSDAAAKVRSYLSRLGERSYEIGEVIRDSKQKIRWVDRKG